MLKFIGVGVLTLTTSLNVFGANISGVPIAWQVENYVPGYVVLWHTPASCVNGQILLPGSATVTDHNRLYATVMAAKVANAKIFINYDVKDNQCIIASFGFV